MGEAPMSIAPHSSRSRRLVALFAPILLALALLVALRLARPEPKQQEFEARGVPVRVLELQARRSTPRALGYGVVQAAIEWELVAEVSGRVVEMNEDLRVGKVIREGTPLLKIDPGNYQLAEKQREASLRGVQAQMNQLSVQRRSLQSSLTIERQALELAQRDLQRARALFASGSATQADVDGAQRAALAQRSAVQSLESQLQEFPTRMASLRAQESESKAGLEGAKLDVGRTTIVAPFDIRVRQLTIQMKELVTAGQVLGVADGVDAAEVEAQLTLGALQPFLAQAESAGDRGRVTSARELGRELQGLGLSALVRIESGEQVAEWRGEVKGITTVSGTTRTIGVVVAVGEPLPSAKATPLLSGMYAEVELTGAEQEGCLAVPRSAVRAGGRVFVVAEGSRLDRREVKVGLRQATYVCVTEGLSPGEQVVLTDVQPAVQDMLLAPRVDEAATRVLIDDLEGRGSAR